MLDKCRFPRDKVCGDAISGKSIGILRELGLDRELDRLPQVKAQGVIFSAPNGRVVEIPFTPPQAWRQSYGYVCRRMIFDNLLFEAAKKHVACVEEFAVTDVIKNGEQIVGVKGFQGRTNVETRVHGKVIIGADGFDSIIARRTGLYEHDSDHWVVATRGYYRGLSGLTDNIEIHFVDDVLPGYFWIFPLEEGWANVGIGMLHTEIKKKNVNLRAAHIAATESPYFKKRFENAELNGGIRGWNLPLGSKRRQIHGNGFLLLGDAAGLIDPFSGEGIGNAMLSAKIAAEVIAAAIARSDFSAECLSQYPERLWQQIGPELQTSHLLQRIGRFKPLLNLVVGKAAKSVEVANWISSMMANEAPKEALASPLTYLRLLFA